MDDGEYMKYTGTVLREVNRMITAGYEKYGNSCLKRGDVGLFMMLARKWDRIEKALSEAGYDYEAAKKKSPPPDGLEDDVYDLLTYLVILASNDLAREVENNPVEAKGTSLEMKEPFGYNEQDEQ